MYSTHTIDLITPECSRAQRTSASRSGEIQALAVSSCSIASYCQVWFVLDTYTSLPYTYCNRIGFNGLPDKLSLDVVPHLLGFDRGPIRAPTARGLSLLAPEERATRSAYQAPTCIVCAVGGRCCGEMTCNRPCPGCRWSATDQTGKCGRWVHDLNRQKRLDALVGYLIVDYPRRGYCAQLAFSSCPS